MLLPTAVDSTPFTDANLPPPPTPPLSSRFPLSRRNETTEPQPNGVGRRRCEGSWPPLRRAETTAASRHGICAPTATCTAWGTAVSSTDTELASNVALG